jgi:hypothetical protein
MWYAITPVQSKNLPLKNGRDVVLSIATNRKPIKQDSTWPVIGLHSCISQSIHHWIRSNHQSDCASERWYDRPSHGWRSWTGIIPSQSAVLPMYLVWGWGMWSWRGCNHVCFPLSVRPRIHHRCVISHVMLVRHHSDSGHQGRAMQEEKGPTEKSLFWITLSEAYPSRSLEG